MKKLTVLVLMLVALVACSDDEGPAPPTGPGPVYQPPASPISGWTYLDSVYTYASGLANMFGVEQRSQTPDTITVLLFNKNVGCTPTPVGIDTLVGAWIAVQFPDTAARTYQQTEVWCEFGVRTHSSTIVTGGLFGKAGLTLVDLDGQKRVRGWIDMSGNNLPFPPPDEITARGTFDVPYCPPPGWSPMTSGTSRDLFSVWGTSPSNVFAVGSNGTIRHFDGTAWGSMTSPTDKFLYGVWGRSDSDVFAVGHDYIDGDGVILHYNGSTWSALVDGTTQELYGVWGTATDVFVAGAEGVRQYDGGNWTVTLNTPWVYDLWGTGQNDVFVVGSVGQAFHYDGQDWTSMVTPESYALRGVWGTSGSDVCAGGVYGRMIHYDGNPAGEWVLMPNETSGYSIFDLWGSATDNIFAVGAYIIHYDGTNWKDTPDVSPHPLRNIYGFSANDIFAVGDYGVVLRYGYN